MLVCWLESFPNNSIRWNHFPTKFRYNKTEENVEKDD